MKKQFCCDASRDLYEKYYVGQSGDGMRVFSGSRGQRGHGLGSMLSGLFRSAAPLLRRGLATFGKHALKTGIDIATDVGEGRGIKESAKRRVREGIKRFASGPFGSHQTGSGKRRKISQPNTAKVIKKRKKKRSQKFNDVFA